MRLNGWQRIGVVLSVIWVAALLWFQQEDNIRFATGMASTAVMICESQQHIDHTKDCSDAFSKGYKEAWKDNPKFKDIFFFSVASLIAPWAIAFILLWIYRWIRDGFIYG